VALNLDMTQWCSRPGGLSRTRSKAHILEAVREGVGASAAENFANLKKDTLVEHAEQSILR
jgi:hypothetical protein